ncbi:type I restriction-modification system subunit M N-terminal domain-containing protein [Corynebacterium macginleyi]|uniref:type I restriction-modification system subunit M N-terminal domain-containing protein n=1 Tax=Corynebacterium macginleyi TaxID=38290 RepID=UPI001EE4B5BD
MRSKIEAQEYKDYILGFIFYKFLSDQVEQLMYENSLCTKMMWSLTSLLRSSSRTTPRLLSLYNTAWAISSRTTTFTRRGALRAATLTSLMSVTH